LEELDLIPLELELSSAELEYNSSFMLEDEGMYSLELLGISTMLKLELESSGSSGGGLLSMLELEGSSLSAQKTSSKLSLPSLHPEKTTTTKAIANKNKRISII
jgi:hypothetical protein